jgi:hypothetical protein
MCSPYARRSTTEGEYMKFACDVAFSFDAEDAAAAQRALDRVMHALDGDGAVGIAETSNLTVESASLGAGHADDGTAFRSMGDLNRMEDEHQVAGRPPVWWWGHEDDPAAAERVL